MNSKLEYWEGRFLVGGIEACEQELWVARQEKLPVDRPWLESLRLGLLELDKHTVAGTIDRMETEILLKAPPEIKSRLNVEIDVETGERLDHISNFFAGLNSNNISIRADFRAIKREYIDEKNHPAENMALFRQLRRVPKKRGPEQRLLPWAGEIKAMKRLLVAEHAGENINHLAQEIADCRENVEETARFKRRLLKLYSAKMSLRNPT